MARNCPGCGAPMVYDPGFDSLVCETCGNIIDPKSLPDADDFYMNVDSTEEPVLMTESMEEEEITNEMYDCHIYTCSQCGAEVIVSGTEVSTHCVYCGATALVFNRISQEARPDYIIPFKVSKEEALKSVKEKLFSGPFVPRFFKRLDPECVRGIYIPYYLYDGWHKDTQRFCIGENYFACDGSCEFVDLPVEACNTLSDAMTDMLDPYDLSEKVPFETSYLMGFYADRADLQAAPAMGNAKKTARKYFDYEMMNQPPKSFRKKLVNSMPSAEFERTSYALLPAWFISVEHEGTPYTFLVNGQTGKVVGTAPWRNSLVVAMIAGIFLSLTALLTLIFWKVGIFQDAARAELVIWVNSRQTPYGILSGEAYGSLIVGSATLAFVGFCFAKFNHVYKNLLRTKSVGTFIFSRKRQGDAK